MTTISLEIPAAAEQVQVVRPARQLADVLAAMDDGKLLGIIRSLPPGSERRAAAYAALVGRYRGLVWACAQRYSRSPEPAEDLVQEGYVGLLKAINNFDPAIGLSLAAYAYPCITGEIKRHFRDRRWQIHVNRSAQELVLEVRQVAGQLTQELGRTPAESDIACHMKISGDKLRDARRAELALSAISLDAPVSSQTGAAVLADLLGNDDPRLDHMLGMRAVATHWGELPSREQKILLMRFQGNMTQAEIGRQLGLSQMHVSRLLAHALGYLRLQLDGVPENSRPHRGRRRTLIAGESGLDHDRTPADLQPAKPGAPQSHDGLRHALARPDAQADAPEDARPEHMLGMRAVAAHWG
jgi:RNA polymerase sigma-B factor